MVFLRPLIVALASLLPVLALAQGAATKLEFETNNYSGYKELIASTPSSKARIHGYLSIPAGAQGKVPAVIFLPHSGGYAENQHRWYRTTLNAEGIATFFVDPFSARDLTPPVTVRDISFATVVADAYAALAALAQRQDIDASRVAIAGFSRGAEAARQAAFESFRKGAGAGELRFAAHVALYPICVTSMHDASDMTGAPTLILSGAKDGSAPPRKCEDYVSFMKSRNAGFPVEVRAYPDAYHGWDDEQNSGQHYPRAPSAANCVPIFLSPKGEFVAMLKDGNEAPFEPSILRCMGAGDTLAFNAAHRDRSTRDLVQFLKARFAAAD